MRKQNAVYWSAPVPDGYGSYTYTDAVEIDCRWEEKQELYIDPLGVEKLSRAVVYVDRDVDLGGMLYLGEIADIDSSGIDPIDLGAFEIKQFAKLPNIRATEFLRQVWL